MENLGPSHRTELVIKGIVDGGDHSAFHEYPLFFVMVWVRNFLEVNLILISRETVV